MTGKIVRVKDKGFGFIKPDEGGPDIFFHATGLKGAEWDAVREGRRVSFDTANGEKGLKAIDIVLL
jgi:CspA family cold shock protein